MKVIGAHSILYSKNAEADRAFLRDVLKFPNVDVGGGWLIFGLPSSEVAVHPADEGEGDTQEFYLMVDDAKAFVAEMKKHKRKTGKLDDPALWHHDFRRPALGPRARRLPADACAPPKNPK